MTSGRFDYIKYDAQAVHQQARLKEAIETCEREMDAILPPGRYKALALTSLEEAYMWMGKAVRDFQIDRGGHQGLQEDRTNS